MSSLHIDVNVYGGTDIPGRAIPDMVALANRLQISVWASLNGVRTLARPGDSAEVLAVKWEQATKKNALTNTHLLEERKMKHAKDCDYHNEQFPPDCTCGLTEAERRVATVRGSYDAPGFDACVSAELAEMKKAK